MDAIAAIEQEQAGLLSEARGLEDRIKAIKRELVDLAPQVEQAQANAERNGTKTLIAQRDRLEERQWKLQLELDRKQATLRAVLQEQQDAAQRMAAAQQAAREAADAALLAEARELADKLDRSGLQDRDSYGALLDLYRKRGERMGWAHPAAALIWRTESIVFFVTGHTVAEHHAGPLAMRGDWKPAQTMREAMRLK